MEMRPPPPKFAGLEAERVVPGAGGEGPSPPGEGWGGAGPSAPHSALLPEASGAFRSRVSQRFFLGPREKAPTTSPEELVLLLQVV